RSRERRGVAGGHFGGRAARRAAGDGGNAERGSRNAERGTAGLLRRAGASWTGGDAVARTAAIRRRRAAADARGRVAWSPMRAGSDGPRTRPRQDLDPRGRPTRAGARTARGGWYQRSR